jgi:hypothetical protein
MAIRSDFEYRLTKIEAEKFEKAIASARERGPNDDVDPRVNQATLEALESELALLRDQLDDYERLDLQR